MCRTSPNCSPVCWVGVVAPRPIVLYGPSWNPVFYGSPAFSLGRWGAQRRITRGSPPAPILSTSLSLNAIFQDLFEVFTKTSLKRIIFLLKHSSKYSPKNIGEYFEKFEGVLFSWAFKVILWTPCVNAIGTDLLAPISSDGGRKSVGGSDVLPSGGGAKSFWAKSFSSWIWEAGKKCGNRSYCG